MFIRLLSLAVFLASLPVFALTRAGIDCLSYKPSGNPSAVMMTFADGPDTRGFAWQTDDSVTGGDLCLLEGVRQPADFGLPGALTFAGTDEDRSEGVVKIRCHRAQATGLAEGKAYSYRLGVAGHYAYGTFTVRGTAVGSFAPIRVLTVSDAQVRSADKLYVWENTVSNAAAVAGSPDLVLSGGDLFDVNWFYKVDANGKNDANWFVHPGYGNLLFGTQAEKDKYKYNYWKWGLDVDLAVPYLRGVPWALASGNHDCEGVDGTKSGSPGNGDIYYEHVTAVNYTRRCHSFDYGNVHFVVLPCLSRGDNASVYDNVVTWLRSDLEKAKTAGRTHWTVVQMHWGIYTTGDHGVNAQTTSLVTKFAPVFSEYHVDLVLQGHDHTYSKTLPYKWDAAGYAASRDDASVINLAPATTTIGGLTYDLNPNGTYYVACGCSGHRVGEDGETYVSATGSKSYTQRTYKVATGKLALTSAYGTAGADASANPAASMFGVLDVKGELLTYTFYTVATDGLSAAQPFDVLRVKKSVAPTAKRFAVTPYVQHPATNAMSLIWFTKDTGTAKLSWETESGTPVGSALTAGVWAEALTNNVYAGETKSTDKYRHRFRMTGLETGTRYRYRVELADGEAYSNSFRTAPGPESSVRFIYYNDSETKSGDSKTTDWTDPKTNENREYFISKNVGYASNIVHMVKRNPDLYVIAGDLAAQGGKQDNWDEFWKHNAGGNGLGYNDPAGSVPIMAAIGNHDLQDATAIPSKATSRSSSGFKGTCENGLGGETALARYLSYFEYEPNGVKYEIGDGETFVDYQTERGQLFHRLEYGPVSLIFIDTNNGTDTDFTSGASYERDTNTGLFRDPAKAAKYGLPACRAPDFNPGSKQYTWLTNCLAEAQRKSKFTFVVNHQCPYSVGYHNRTNITEGGEWLSARAVRVLNEAMIRYGVDGWLCGHDEMVEHSQIRGEEILPDGTRRAKTVDIYDMGTAGDGLRGQQMTKEYNPCEVWRAHKDAPEVWENGVLVSGGKHYGHMEIEVTKEASGRWKCVMTPVYIFVSEDSSGKPCKFERRVYDDVVTLYADEPKASDSGMCVLLK